MGKTINTKTNECVRCVAKQMAAMLHARLDCYTRYSDARKTAYFAADGAEIEAYVSTVNGHHNELVIRRNGLDVLCMSDCVAFSVWLQFTEAIFRAFDCEKIQANDND